MPLQISMLADYKRMQINQIEMFSSFYASIPNSLFECNLFCITFTFFGREIGFLCELRTLQPKRKCGILSAHFAKEREYP